MEDGGNPFADVAASDDDNDDGVGNPFAAAPAPAPAPVPAPAGARARPALQRTRSRSLGDVRHTLGQGGPSTAAWQAVKPAAPPAARAGRARSGSVSLHRAPSAPTPSGMAAAAATSSSSGETSSGSGSGRGAGEKAASPSAKTKTIKLKKFLSPRSRKKRRHTLASVPETAGNGGDDSSSGSHSDESTSISSSGGGAWVRAAKANEMGGKRPAAATRTRPRTNSIGLRGATTPLATAPRRRTGGGHPPLGGTNAHARQASAPIVRPALHQALERADRAGKNAEQAAARADAATAQLRRAGSEVRSTVRDLETALGQRAVFASAEDVARMQRDAQRGRQQPPTGAAVPWPADTASDDDDHNNNNNNNSNNREQRVSVSTGGPVSRTLAAGDDDRTTVRIEYPPFQRNARPNVTIETRGARTAPPGSVSAAGDDAADTAALQAALQPLVSPVTKVRLRQAREALLDADEARAAAAAADDPEAASSSSSASSSYSDSDSDGDSDSDSASSRSRRPGPGGASPAASSSERDAEDDDNPVTFFFSDEDSLLTASSDEDDAAAGWPAADDAGLVLRAMQAQFRAARQQQRRDLARLADAVDRRVTARLAATQRHEARARAAADRGLAAGVRRATRATRTKVKTQHKRTRAALAREREASTRALAHVLSALEALVTPVEQQVATTDLFRRAAEDIQAVVGAQHELTKRRFERLTEEHDAIRQRDTARIRSLEAHVAALQRENEQLRFELRRDQRILQEVFPARVAGPPRVEALPGPDMAGSSSSDDPPSQPPAPMRTRLTRARTTATIGASRVARRTRTGSSAHR